MRNSSINVAAYRRPEMLAPGTAGRDTGGMEAQPERVAAAKPKRRWLQFGLATLLLLTLVCAVVLALWVAPAARQRHTWRLLWSM
jgi:hypothetical protein